MDWMSVTDAAEALAVSPQQIRRLIRAGAMPASKLAGSWVVPTAAVRERRDAGAAAGRPVTARHVWWLLGALDAVATGAANAPMANAGSSMRALRRLVDDAPPVPRWDHWLRNRGKPVRWSVHPAAVARLHADPTVRSVTSDVWPGAQSFYVAAPAAGLVAERFDAQVTPDGEVRLRIFDSDAAPDELPAATAVVDLLGSVDARARHRAIEVLDQWHVELRRTLP